MKMRLLLSVICLLQCVHFTRGTVMTFQIPPHGLKQGLTQTLTLNCSVSDSAPSASIIGKRDVTHTTDNVMLLTSLVVTKDGLDLASVNSASAAHVVDGSANVQAAGSVRGHSGRTGFLQLTITDPTANQTGEFVCEATALTATGHGVIFSSTVEVSSSEPSLADLVTFVMEVNKKNQDLSTQVQDLVKKNDDLEKKNEDLNKKVQDLDTKNANLEQMFSQLKNKSEAMVFFNARISGNPHYASGKDVVFNDVLHNKGNDYNIANGHFTCTLPGYYHFSLGCLSYPNKRMGLNLEHNGSPVFTIYGAPGHSEQAAANTATLQLQPGDVVNVRTSHDSTIDGAYCSFSGHLIEAL